MSKQFDSDKSEKKLTTAPQPNIKKVFSAFNSEYEKITQRITAAKKVIRRFANWDPYDLILVSVPRDERQNLVLLARYISTQTEGIPVLLKQGDQYSFYIDSPSELKQLKLEQKLAISIPFPNLGLMRRVRTTELAPELYEILGYEPEETGESRRIQESLKEYLENETKIFHILIELNKMVTEEKDLLALQEAEDKTFTIYENILDYLWNLGLMPVWPCPDPDIAAIYNQLLKFMNTWPTEKIINNMNRYVKYVWEVGRNFADSPEQADLVKQYVQSNIKYFTFFYNKIAALPLNDLQKSNRILPSFFYVISLYSGMVLGEYSSSLFSLIPDGVQLNNLCKFLRVFLQFYDKVEETTLIKRSYYKKAMLEFIDVCKSSLKAVDRSNPLHIQIIAKISAVFASQPSTHQFNSSVFIEEQALIEELTNTQSQSTSSADSSSSSNSSSSSSIEHKTDQFFSTSKKRPREREEEPSSTNLSGPLSFFSLNTVSNDRRITYPGADGLFHPIIPLEWDKYIKLIRTTKSGKPSKAELNCDPLTAALARGVLTGKFQPADSRVNEKNKFIYTNKTVVRSIQDKSGNNKQYLTYLDSSVAYESGRLNQYVALPCNPLFDLRSTPDNPKESRLVAGNFNERGFEPIKVEAIDLLPFLKKLARDQGGWVFVTLSFNRLELFMEKEQAKAEEKLQEKLGHLCAVYVVDEKFNKQYGSPLRTEGQQSELITFLEPQAYYKNSKEEWVTHRLKEIASIIEKGGDLNQDLFDSKITILMVGSHNIMEDKAKKSQKAESLSQIVKQEDELAKTGLTFG